MIGTLAVPFLFPLSIAVTVNIYFKPGLRTDVLKEYDASALAVTASNTTFSSLASAGLMLMK